MTRTHADIAVVHLVWGPLGTTPLREFLASLRRHPAGTDHELVLLFNGVDAQQRSILLDELDGVDHHLLELDSPVQDLCAYAQAAERLEHRWLCFLNSYSTILAPNWLALLEQAFGQPRAGLVGATGSWASLRSLMAHSLSLPSSYRRVIPNRHTTFEQLGAIRAGLDGSHASTGGQEPSPKTSRLAAIADVVHNLPSIAEQISHFEGFPAHHLRTNAFMVERTLFTRLKLGRLARKTQAYRLESGRHSFTAQIEARGLRAFVVDRRGEAHLHPAWPASRTFWQGEQEGLLVADNQTRIYEEGSLERRRLLAGLAWGSQADPRDPPAQSGSLEAPPASGS